MADKKISELTAATSLDGTELLPVVQSGETKKAAMTAIAVAVRNYLLDSGADLPYGPDYLFSHGEQGAWYDPSDLTTGNMYQDSAKTTAVTAVEQPVGWVQDKSGRGNHASQPTSAARPVLSARVNLLTYTEQFDNAFWAAFSARTVVSNATTAPDGTTTADEVKANSNTTNNGVFETTVAVPNNSTISFYSKAASVNYVAIGVAGTAFNAWFDLVNGVVTSSSGGTASITAVGSGWYRCVLAVSTGASRLLISPKPSAGTGDPWSNVTNAVGDSVYLWGADLRVANDGVGLPDYQRVAAATDYDTTGFPQRVNFDKTDDSVTASSGGGSTTAFFFCAAIRIGAVGAAQTIYSDTGTNTGYRIRINSSNQLEMAVGNGSAYTTVNTTATFALGERAVITCWHDGTNIYAQKNKSTAASQSFATATAGTSGFTLGKDNGAASSFFGGGIYEYVHVKDAHKGDSARSQAQRYCASKGIITL